MSHTLRVMLLILHGLRIPMWGYELTAALDRGVDDLRVKVFAMLEAQGGVQ